MSRQACATSDSFSPAIRLNSPITGWVVSTGGVSALFLRAMPEVYQPAQASGKGGSARLTADACRAAASRFRFSRTSASHTCCSHRSDASFDHRAGFRQDGAENVTGGENGRLYVGHGRHRRERVTGVGCASAAKMNRPSRTSGRLPTAAGSGRHTWVLPTLPSSRDGPQTWHSVHLFHWHRDDSRVSSNRPSEF